MSYEYNSFDSRPSFWNSLPVAVRNLILINFIVWGATELIGMRSADGENWIYQTFALFAFESPFFRPWQLVTHLFMHGGFWHIFFNMYSLLIFGSVLERMWGARKFLVFYFVAGLGAALCHCLVMHFQIDAALAAENTTKAFSIMRTPTVGASGAIYGVLMGYGMLFPNDRLTLIFPPITLNAKWFVIIFIVIELVTGIMGADNIAHFAHLGGMLFGWLLILYWKKKNRLYY